MALSSVILRLGLPLVLAGGGIAAFVTAPTVSPAAAPSPLLWIDSPVDGGSLDAGDVTVVAHAGDGLEVTELRLEIDGDKIATSRVESFGRLASASFAWKATDGFHTLVVLGGGKKSATVTVSVGDHPESAPTSSPGALAPDPTVDESAAPELATTTSMSVITVPGSPTTLRPSTATTTSPSFGGPSPEPTPSPTSPSASTEPTTAAPPTTNPTPTSAPPPTAAPSTTAPRPTVGTVTVSPKFVSFAACDQDIRVTAPVASATSGSATVRSAGGFEKNIGGSIQGDQFVVVFRQRDLTGSNTSGRFEITVTVNGPGGSASSTGVVDISCTKD